MERVKFYSVADLANKVHLATLEERMDQFSPDRNDFSIAEIIELYNIIRFIDAALYLKRWSEEYITKLKSTVPALNKTVAVFMKSICDSNFAALYDELEYDYFDDFWELIDKYKVYLQISQETIRKVLFNKAHILRYFLMRKRLVDYYANVLREVLLAEEKNAEILLEKFAVHHDDDRKELFFPTSLTGVDREELVNRYIQWSDVNLNYLRIIANTLSKSGLVLSNKTRLAAQKRAEKENNKYFENNTGFTFGASVGFSKELSTDFEIAYKDGMIECIYDEKWIDDNLDYNTLLNNFIHLFDFVDLHMKITLVSKPSYLGVLERSIFIRSQNSYPIGIGFEQVNKLSDLQMIMYSRILKTKEIRLESVFEWFFRTYLYDEFGIEDFRIRMPSEDASYLEKCRAILPEIESALKQYQLYVEDNRIDHELLQMSSEHLFFKNVKSNVPTKYVYPKGDEYPEIAFYLFSDQSGLAYTELTRSKYSTLFDLLRKELVTKDNFQQCQQFRLNRMLDLGYLVTDDKNILRFADHKVISILRDSYKNEVISYWHYSAEHRSVIDKLIVRGLMESESSLFSRPEQAYFNYHLNKADFCNSLDLRNRYVHGTQPSDESSEQTHETNYYIFLKLLILIIIKINDDLCLIDKISVDKHTEESE